MSSLLVFIFFFFLLLLVSYDFVRAVAMVSSQEFCSET